MLLFSKVRHVYSCRFPRFILPTPPFSFAFLAAVVSRRVILLAKEAATRAHVSLLCRHSGSFELWDLTSPTTQWVMRDAVVESSGLMLGACDSYTNPMHGTTSVLASRRRRNAAAVTAIESATSCYAAQRHIGTTLPRRVHSGRQQVGSELGRWLRTFTLRRGRAT